MFVAEESGDYRLVADSPCVDSGNNDYVETISDFAGNERIANGTVDIGCYECGASLERQVVCAEGNAVNAQVGEELRLTFTAKGIDVAYWMMDPECGTLESNGGAAVWRWIPEESDVGTKQFVYAVFDKDDCPLVCAVSVTVTSAGGGRAKYGVFVGLNQYNTSYISKGNWLTTCVPDAMHMYTNTTQRGEWTDATVTVLTNALGTKAAIRTAISNAAATCKSGDTFLYYQSSHGGSYDGKYDVCLCAYDADYTDSELAADLAQFRSGVKVVVMVDACHSGGLFKSVKGKKLASRAEKGSFALAERVGAAIDAIRADERKRAIKAAKIASSGIGWLTAADYNQYSCDAEDGGAFTSAALAGWKTGVCDNATYGDQDGYANFYELWNYAKDIATGAASSGENHTDAQCYNEAVLKATIAGWVGERGPEGR